VTTLPRTLLAPIQAPQLPDGIVFEDRTDRLLLSATTDLSGFASGRFVEPTITVELPLVADDDTVYLGHGWTQFAMPMRATPTQPFDLTPASNLFSPAAVLHSRSTQPTVAVCSRRSTPGTIS
jgi:hypothetical protein